MVCEEYKGIEGCEWRVHKAQPRRKKTECPLSDWRSVALGSLLSPQLPSFKLLLEFSLFHLASVTKIPHRRVPPRPPRALNSRANFC